MIVKGKTLNIRPIVVAAFLFSAVLFLILGVDFQALLNPIPKDAKITLHRRGCVKPPEPCPVYTVTVNRDGMVNFTGEYFVNSIGTVTYNIPKEDVHYLFDEFESANFFSLANEYLVESERITGAYTSITFDGRSKEVEHYGAGCGFSDPTLDNAPEALCKIEALIDEVTNTQQYIYGNN